MCKFALRLSIITSQYTNKYPIMRHSAPILATLALLAASCGHDKEAANKTPYFGLDSNRSAEASAPLKVKNLTFAQLSGDSAAMYFKKATITGVTGDSVILLENDPEMSRLIIYSIKDGRYLGEINHRGQGPDEYRVILGAFVNDNDGTVLLPNFDTPSVYKYSLSADTLVATIEREMVMTMIEPTGGVKSAINVAVPSAEGLKILQYDGNYQLMDSIGVEGFRGGNFNMLWANAGANGVFMMADTLYTLTRGEMKPTAILTRGEYALTPEQDEELTMKAMSGADELELLKPYILVRDVEYTDGKMLLTTMYDGRKYSDIYDMTDGSLIYRSIYDRISMPSSITIEGADGKTINVESLFAKDGKWYGIVNEESMEAMGNQDSDNMNCGIVSFEM